MSEHIGPKGADFIYTLDELEAETARRACFNQTEGHNDPSGTRTDHQPDF
ncbi:MAG TPA: hypothetical protein VF944_00550 [Candidatus Bathyarchaeia archaeon]